MKYGKPEIHLLGKAAEAIQGSPIKDEPLFPDVPHGPDVCSPAAYEADE
jgi:hypothetical protein